MEQSKKVGSFISSRNVPSVSDERQEIQELTEEMVSLGLYSVWPLPTTIRGQPKTSNNHYACSNFKYEECAKEFQSSNDLNGHKRMHRDVRDKGINSFINAFNSRKESQPCQAPKLGVRTAHLTAEHNAAAPLMRFSSDKSGCDEKVASFISSRNLPSVSGERHEIQEITKEMVSLSIYTVRPLPTMIRGEPHTGNNQYACSKFNCEEYNAAASLILLSKNKSGWGENSQRKRENIGLLPVEMKYAKRSRNNTVIREPPKPTCRRTSVKSTTSMKMKNKDSTYICEVCGKRYENRIQLGGHKRAHFKKLAQ